MILATAPVIAPGTWTVDPSASSIGFAVRHFGVATCKGRFTSFAGSATAGDAGLTFGATIDAASVATGNDIRDRRLRQEFFVTAGHPTIALTDGRAELGADGRGTIRARLTIREVTRPVELDARVTVLGDDRVAVQVTGELSRSDFGLEWDALREGGRLLVADRVRLSADVVIARTDP